jgi:hypothetical protein
MEKVFVLLFLVLVVYWLMRFIEYRYIDSEEERTPLRTIIRDSLMVSAAVVTGGTGFFYFDRYLVGFFNSVMNTDSLSKVVDRENIQIFTDDPGF